MAGLVLGLLAAVVTCFHSWYYSLLAAFLIESSHVLDCVDGELARLTGRGNPFAAAMDPITDRIKDLSILFAAYFFSANSDVFGLPLFHLSTIAFFTVGLWLIYMYIVDSYLNPARKLKPHPERVRDKRLYIGLYDLFIYGSIVFLISGTFAFFLFYILFCALLGIPYQIFRLRKFLLLARTE